MRCAVDTTSYEKRRPSVDLSITEMLENRQSLGIYIHIPFCKSRCIYCDFVSSVDSPVQRDKYVDYLCKQIRLAGKEYGNRYTVDTIYIGGGTPTLLDNRQLSIIGKEIEKAFYCDLKEFSVEANPCTVDREKLIALKEMGVTRLSIGVQSFNGSLLKMLGRRHDSKRAEEAVKLAVEYGFDVSVDAMIGLPEQIKEDVETFIDKADLLGVKHISLYMLSVENGTRLKELVDNHKLVTPSDDETAEMYECACLQLENQGYQRYEISNFCKDGKISRHNMHYWQCADYLGLGMGAHSFINGERWRNADMFYEYYGALDKDIYKFDVIKLSVEEREAEFIMLALRLKDGINTLEFKVRFGFDFALKYQKALEKNKKYLDISQDRISIKYKYLQLMNSIIVDFI
ncbi:MAG: radical SAM family heme chaperone HemW [Clostridia bacterium]|nr:radical SAM family heme chaperone HemW [Clostridia bacterium]